MDEVEVQIVEYIDTGNDWMLESAPIPCECMSHVLHADVDF